MNTQEVIELYEVRAERHEPVEKGAKIITDEYRILAASVSEAHNIVNDGLSGTDDTIIFVARVSHITLLPTSRHKIVPATDKPVPSPATVALVEAVKVVMKELTRKTFDDLDKALADFEKENGK